MSNLNNSLLNSKTNLYDYNLIGGVDGRVTVKKRYGISTDTTTKEIQPVSHYKTDYIVTHYEYLIKKELDNQQVTEDDNFKDFISKVSDLSKNIARAREENDSDYAVPAGTKSDDDGTDVNYKDNISKSDAGGGQSMKAEMTNIAPDLLRQYQYYDPSDPDGKFIGTFIYIPTAGYPAGKRFVEVTGGVVHFGPPDNPNMFDFYFKDFPLSITGSARKITTDIDEIEASWKKYDDNKNIGRPGAQELYDIKTKFNETMIAVNNAITNKGYAGRYEVIEKLLNDIPYHIDNAASANFTEANIWMNMPDASHLYENLNFRTEDISGALPKGVPSDSVDVILLKNIKDDITKLAQSTPQGTTIEDLKFGLRMRAKTVSRSDTGQIINRLIEERNKANMVPASQNTLKLMYGTIFDDDGVKKSEYLDPAQRVARTNKIRAAQNIYIQRIMGPTGRYERYESVGAPPYDTTPIFPQSPPIIPPEAPPGYPVVKFQEGGRKPRANKYRIKKRSTQIISNIQAGGAMTDFADYATKIKKESEDIISLRNSLNELNGSMKRQEQTFFENREILDTSNVEQRNEYLLEMMNVLLITRFLITDRNRTTGEFTTELETRMKDFRKNLTSIWSIMSKRIDTIEANTSLRDLLARGNVQVSQFQDFFRQSGLNVNAVTYEDDILLNAMPYINTITALRDRYAIDDVAEILKSLLSTGVSITGRETGDLTNMYTDLNKYYTLLQNFRTSLRSSTDILIDTSINLDEITGAIGEILNRNLLLANTFARNVVATLNNYDLKIGIYRRISRKMNTTKGRLQELEIYLDQMNHVINNFSIMGEGGSSQLKKDLDDTFTGDDFKGNLKIARYYVDYRDYIKKSRESSQRFTPYISSSERLLSLNQKIKTISDRLERFNVLSDIVYSDYGNKTRDLNVSKADATITESPEIIIDNNILEDVTQRISTINKLAGNLKDITFSQATDDKYKGQLARNFNATANGNNLINTIKMIVQINYTLSNSYIYFYPEILDRLNIPDILMQYLQLTAAPSIGTMKKYVDSVINNRDKIGTNKLLNITTRIHNNIVKQMNILETYGEVSVSTLAGYRSDESDFYNKIFINKKYMDNDADDIDTYLDYLKNVLINRLEKITEQNTIIDNLLADYENIYIRYMQYNGLSDDEAIKLHNDQISTFGTSFLQYYYDELAALYQLLNSYTLENNTYNTSFARLTERQRNVTALGSYYQNIPALQSAKTLEFPNITDKIDSIKITAVKPDPPNVPDVARDIYSRFSVYGTRAIKLLQVMRSASDQYKFPENYNKWNIFYPNDFLHLYGSETHLVGQRIFDTVTEGKRSFEVTNPVTSKKHPIKFPETKPGQYRVVDFNFGKDNNIDTDEYDKMISTINTSNVILKILPDLYQCRRQLAQYVNNPPADAVKNTNKKILIDVLDKLARLDHEIRLEKNIIFIDKLLLPSNLIYLDVRSYLGTLTTTSLSFNNDTNRVRDFCNNITSSYISIMLRILPKLLNPELHEYIVGLIKENVTADVNYDTTNITPYAIELSSFVKVVAREFDTKKNVILRDYVEPEKSIDDSGIYNDYYSNGGTETSPFFYLILVSENEISPKFTQFNNAIRNMLNFNVAINGYTSAPIIGEPIDTLLKSTIEMYEEEEEEEEDNMYKMAERLVNVLRDAFRARINDVDDMGGNIRRGIDLIAEIILKDLAREAINDSRNVDPETLIEPGTFINEENYKLDNERYKKLPGTNADYIKNMAYAHNHGLDKQFLHVVLDLYFKDVFELIEAQVIYSYLDKIHKIFQEIINDSDDRDIHNLYNTLLPYLTLLKPPDIYVITGRAVPVPPTMTNISTKVNNVMYLLNTSPYPRGPALTDKLETANRVVRSLTEPIKKNISTNITSELDFVNNLVSTQQMAEYTLLNDQSTISERIIQLKNILAIQNQVMFDVFFKQTSFISPTDIMARLTDTIDNFTSVNNIIEQKLGDIIRANNQFELVVSQLTNYSNFTLNLGKTFEGETMNETKQVYKRMSFGLIEFYLDIMTEILKCIESKSFDSMHPIEKDLYELHYIQLKRCHALFLWIRNTYLPSVQMEENLRKERGQFTQDDVIALRKKIEVFQTKNIINTIFNEFNGLKDLLDDYQITIMPPVSLHLRINDWVADKTERDPILKDYNPSSAEYLKYLDNQVFKQHERIGKKLLVNFNTVRMVRPREAEPLEDLYRDIADKMRESPPGITFERIYSPHIFPDSDVISNYMSLAPNIKKGKGTVIMTYGYSGVGKSASLFGVSKDDPDGPKMGILQTTMDQFAGESYKIYFRVFEIYGLGTQFNFYWNQSMDDNQTGARCYPDIYQILIHHNLKVSGSTLSNQGAVPITNKANIFSYIMNMRNPKYTTGPPPTPPAEDARPLIRSEYENSKLDAIIAGEKFIDSSYVQIDERHYRDFSKFVETEIESKRSSVGVEVTQIFTNTLYQVKATVNNPVSSRSILVYDFQIEINEKDPMTGNIISTIYVPFLIYDLPGKEDLFRTFVEPTPDEIETALRSIPPESMKAADRARIKNAAFSDFNDDYAVVKNDTNTYRIKERKSSYILNPFMIPVFDNNYEIVKNILIEVDRVINPDLLSTLLYDILNYRFNNWEMGEGEDESIKISTTSRAISVFYTDSSTITTFGELLDHDNINWDIDFIGEKTGILEYFVNADKKDALMIIIAIVIMKTLIKFKMFDVIVEMIFQCAKRQLGLADTSWTREKIYSFFEAYYINENVIGLLQYLIRDVLKIEREIFQKQNATTAKEATDKNIQFSSVFRFINHYVNIVREGDNAMVNIPELKIDEELLTAKNDREKADIDRIKLDFKINDDGSYAYEDKTYVEAFDALRLAIQRTNKGSYDNNKIFRDGFGFPCSEPDAPANYGSILDPKTNVLVPESNRPLLQDFLEPYRQKINLYYVFYVVSNTKKRIKAEEQIKLLNNSMPFIKELYGLDTGEKKKTCV